MARGRACLLLGCWLAVVGGGATAWAQVAAPAPAASAAVAPAKPAAAASAGGQQVVIEGRNDDAASRRRQATVASTIVGRDELEAHGDTSVLDVLQRVPGISLDGDVPRLRGLGAGYTQILLNGEPAPPGFSLDSLAPSEIERIEIVKGPTAEFGGAAGTINVILRQPPKLQQREWRAALGYRAIQPQGSTGFHWGDRFGAVGLFVPISVYSWANGAQLWQERLSRRSDGVLSRQQVQGRDQWLGHGLNLGPRLDWKISDTESLQWQAFVQRNWHSNQGWRDTVALEGPEPSLVHDESRSRGGWRLARSQAQWQRKRADGERLELKASLQGSRWTSTGRSQGLTPSGDDGALRESDANHSERSHALGARWRRPWADSHTLSLGADFDWRRREELNRRFDDGVEQITRSVGLPFEIDVRKQVLFAQDEWALGDDVSLNTGLRAESVDTRLAANGPAVHNRYRLLSPTLQWRMALDPKSRDVLRAGLARSVRAPDLGLLLPRYSLNGAYDKDTANTPIAADSAGNPLLRPERIWALDLGFEHYLPGDGVLSVGAFHRRVQNLIRRRIALESVAEASQPRWVSRPVNLGQARSSGLELEIKGPAQAWLGRWWTAAPKTLQLRAALSLYRSSVEQIDDPDARLEGQPPWQATLGLDWRELWPAWTLGATLAHTPAYSTAQTDRQHVWRGSAQRLDAYLLWRLDRSTSLRLAVNNLLEPDSLGRNSVTDLDGFTAGATTRRNTVAQFNAHFQWRF
ncbi:MAG: TonB-dependent receptor [Burkholderiaceae bacterium]|nr:TonB-dependent receptor [Burkholderiaceae bacterium]